MRFFLKIKLQILTLLFSGVLSAQVTNYYLMEPSRDGKKEQLLQIGENNGTKILAMASCAQCMPATYVYNINASKAYGKAVYGQSGIYVITYDENSYVSVTPKSPAVPLGEGKWQTFLYSNFFSESKTKVNNMSKMKTEQWAVNLSKNIMNGEIITTDFDANGNKYYSALKPSSPLNIDLAEKTINIGSDIFYYNTTFSKLLNKKVYSDDANRSEHVFVESNVSLIWAKYANGHDLGKSDWGEHEKFNYYHKNQQEIRSLLISKEKQNNIDKKLAEWSSKAKQFVEKTYAKKEMEEIKNRRLPKKGLRNNTLETQATSAARQWANSYGWEETVTKAYFTGNDWSIYRNSLTRAQLGRRISGVIVLKRKDGRCSFHYASFAQQFNGSSYQKVFTEGITPGQNILECKYVF